MHPVEALEASLRGLRVRAMVASVALVAVAIARAVDIGVRQYSTGLIAQIPPRDAEPASQELMDKLVTADALVDGNNIALMLTFAVSAVTFLVWTHRLVFVARKLGAAHQWTPAQAVWGFIVPLVSLIRPYQVFSTLASELQPENVAPPPLVVDPMAQASYRGTTFAEPPPMRPLAKARVGLWWGAFLVMCIGERVMTIGNAKTDRSIEEIITAYHGEMLISAFAVLAALLAITVIRGLTTHAAERHRRIRATTPESLADQDITLL